MLKESAYSPVDVSYADARGLLQMLPATSARVAAGIGEGFSDEQLYLPEVNVRLGAAYIGSLARKFGGVPVAAGSFNAGPRAMVRWCDQNGRLPLDEFVELVTYEQTREYIKRVAQIYSRYKYLYRSEAWEPSLETTCRYDKGGPDF
jgi:soluble lytic murein transglycosylase